jgi:hypothetical protein
VFLKHHHLGSVTLIGTKQNYLPSKYKQNACLFFCTGFGCVMVVFFVFVFPKGVTLIGPSPFLNKKNIKHSSKSKQIGTYLLPFGHLCERSTLANASI